MASISQDFFGECVNFRDSVCLLFVLKDWCLSASRKKLFLVYTTKMCFESSFKWVWRYPVTSLSGNFTNNKHSWERPRLLVTKRSLKKMISSEYKAYARVALGTKLRQLCFDNQKSVRYCAISWARQVWPICPRGQEAVFLPCVTESMIEIVTLW